MNISYREFRPGIPLTFYSWAYVLRTSIVLNLDVRYTLAIKSGITLHARRKTYFGCMEGLDGKKEVWELNSGAPGLATGTRRSN